MLWLNLRTEESLEIPLRLFGSLLLLSVALEPVSVPIKNDKRDFVTFSRSLKVIQYLVVGGDRVCELLGHRQIIWFTVCFLAALLVLDFTLITNVAIWILRKVCKHVMLSKYSNISKGMNTIVNLCVQNFHTLFEHSTVL